MNITSSNPDIKKYHDNAFTYDLIIRTKKALKPEIAKRIYNIECVKVGLSKYIVVPEDVREVCAIVFDIDMPMLITMPMKSGNKKLDSGILCWYMTPHTTCPECSQCENCYAMRSFNSRKSIRTNWNIHTALATVAYDFLERALKYQIATCTKTIVRINGSGDMFSTNYVDLWNHVACEFPEVHFYGYSKCFNFGAIGIRLHVLNSLPNVNIVNSLPMGVKNYGSIEYVYALAERLGGDTVICPCGTDKEKELKAATGKKKVCGVTCFACLYAKYVLFIEH